MIRIYGASDDYVCIEGPSLTLGEKDWHDEVNPGRMITIGTPERGMYVTFRYAVNKKSGAVWRGCVEQLEEGIPMFPLTVVEAEPGGFPDPKSYSVMFVIDCPNDTPINAGKTQIPRGGKR